MYCTYSYGIYPHSPFSSRSHSLSNMAKSRGWTFPLYPSPVDGVAPVPFADCQCSFLAIVCVTFLCTAGEGAVSLKEEHSGTDGEDAVEAWGVVVGVLKEQCSILEDHDSL